MVHSNQSTLQSTQAQIQLEDNKLIKDQQNQNKDQNQLNEQTQLNDLDGKYDNQNEKAEINQQKQKQQFRLDNYDFTMGIPNIFYIFFANITKLMYILNKNVIKKNQKLDIHHIPNLKEEEKVENQYLLMEEALERISKGKYIKGKHVYNMVSYVFRKDFIVAHITISLSLIIKTFNSVLIQQIISSYKDDEKTIALFWTFMLFILFIISVTLFNISVNLVQTMSTQIRLNLVTFLYTKTSNLTQYQIQKACIGKLFNLISQDLSIIEMTIYFAFMVIYIPLLLVVSGVILYLRLGGYGLLSIQIIFLIVPLQLFNGIRQKKYINIKNKFSDERIKLVDENIQGIRLMKMYGWEEAFGKFVFNVRKKELDNIFKMQICRALDRGVSTAFVLIATFFPILIIYYKDAIEINSSLIFATLEQLYGIKNALFQSGMGISFMFQVGLILNRFADFLRLKKQSITTLEYNPSHNNDIYEKQTEIKKKKEQLVKQKLMYLKENPEGDKDKKIMKQFELTKEESDTLNINNNKYNQKEYKIQEPISDENAIEFNNFYSFWDSESPPVLKNVTLNIKKGRQYGIVGKVGSGKSTLLQTVLDEIPHLQGELRKKGSVCFVEQEPYVFSGKLKDNILFGKPYEEEFYNKVLKACCMVQDLEHLPNGDETEIGERGINLSGGQKARLSLTRAIYSKSDIYLFDDPLSAVDSKVARRLYKDCLNGLLKNKTVLLVTHQIHFTKSCDEIFVMDDGKVIHRGSFNDLEDILLKMVNQQAFDDEKPDSYCLSTSTEQVQKDKENNQANEMKQIKQVEKKKNEEELKLAAIKEKKGRLFTQENQEKFELSLKTYKTYFGYVKNNLLLVFVIILYLSSEGFYTSFYYTFGSYDEKEDKNQLFYVSGLLMLGFLITCISKYLLTVYCTRRVSMHLHHHMFIAVTRTPILYFDQTPSGRILNKFSNDLGTTDVMLPFMLFDSIEQPLQLINICITVGIFNPYFFMIAFSMITLTMLLLKSNKPIIVSSKQLDLMFKSPVFTLFSKTIQGIVHIRIYKQIDEFLKQMFKHANNSIRTNFAVWRFNRAFSFNQQIITSTFSIIGIILSIYTSTDSNKMGQSIIYLTMLIEIIATLSRQIPNLDSNMTSVERVLQLCSLPQEDSLINPTDHLLYQNSKELEKNQKKLAILSEKQQSWVKNGDIVFQNVKMKYRKDLDLVLKGTNFKINGGERVGCVGRTGAGKSSILQAMFRMCPIEKDSLITIDGINIKEIGLHTLRNSISIIPQAPFVFSGSIRRNLDPLEQYTDDQIWQSLQQTDLEETIKKLPHNILTDMSNAQSVFSTGQKQLICLARAILKNSKILVLDEATANVDMKTDEFIQNAIKEQFSNSTIFTIAHRLNTIADYDKVIVMDQGTVAECDQPYKLLVKNIGDKEITSDSIFAQMVLNTGKENSRNIFKVAKEKYFEELQVNEK